ncbi:hypothetical protein GCM10010977_02940 [Citricoccus zhacaiensis]|uniref:DUF1648 domain-containing protein n=1 Tax=Citricoccus zhacaiensis TaxID=489142 RepID=A0ABQ2LPD9_9MICC|nr:hypothetical protein [Citricoccus zhacaiensis]GGO40526.1 hypothetical protein GCM10010977_02940 [Citricoccus zhacaiensis]
MTAEQHGVGTADEATVGGRPDHSAERSPDRTPGRYLDAGERRRAVRLTRTVPAAAIALVVALYAAAAASGMMPLQWVSHVDGRGNAQYSAHWPLVTAAVAAAAVAFVVGWLLAREHAQAGHWHDLEKGIVVAAYGTGHGLLGVVIANIAASLGRPAATAGQEQMGLALLGFVLAFIAAAVVYTATLPKARGDRWTPRY